MIKLNEIIEKYQDYEIDEEKLKEILVKPKPKSVWELNKGDRYYNIGYTSYGFRVCHFEWSDIPYDKEFRDIGDIFLTKEEAQFEIERRKIETILLKYGRRNFKYNKSNYIIGYCFDTNRFRFDVYNFILTQGVIYFDTRELCQKAIEEAGRENIKKYLFGVDEDDSTQTNTEEN